MVWKMGERLRVAPRLDVLDDAIERHLVMGEGPERRPLDLGQQVTERRILVDRDVDGQRVGEETDEVGGFGLPVGGGRPDDEVVLPRPARQHGDVAAQEEHERRHAGAGAGRLEAGHHRQRDADLHHAAGERAHGRTRPIAGEVEHRQVASQLLHPVVELTGDGVGAEALALPRGEVGVLHLDRGQRWR